ncbi:hypothetical protein, partial [Rhodanobacter thiooxydans]
ELFAPLLEKKASTLQIGRFTDGQKSLTCRVLNSGIEEKARPSKLAAGRAEQKTSPARLGVPASERFARGWPVPGRAEGFGDLSSRRKKRSA